MNAHDEYAARNSMNENSHGQFSMNPARNVREDGPYRQPMDDYHYNCQNFEKNEDGFYFEENYTKSCWDYKHRDDETSTDTQSFVNLPQNEELYHKNLVNCDQHGNAFSLNSFNRKSAEDPSPTNSKVSGYLENADRENLNKTLNTLRLFTNRMEYIQG